jgi:hypothetical protein
MPTDRRAEGKPSRDARERLLEIIECAYEGAVDAADRGLIDFSIIGEPLAKALCILRNSESDDVAA